MKGVVFNLLEKMVEETFGLKIWDKLLTDTAQDGIFVASESYPDEQLVALVAALNRESGIPVHDLVRSFGEYMFPTFYDQNPEFFNEGMTLIDFLKSVDRVIHVEVRKLNPDAALPKFDYKDERDHQLTMIYSSPRKMCMLAEGLICGAAKHFNTEYVLTHDRCMHDGEDACHLQLKIAV